MSDLTFDYAKESVLRYTAADDKLIQDSREAMDCYDCEAFLQLGINAFEWLQRADIVIRKALYNEVYKYDSDIEAALKDLCVHWLKPCKDAFSWIAIQKKRGFEVSNLKEFQNCCNEMKAIVESSSEESTIPSAVAVIASQAIQEHRDGETAEFF